MAHDLLSSATAETSCSSEDARLHYADEEMDQLLEDLDFRISCLLELSPSIQRCTEQGDAEFMPLPAVPDSSFELLQHAPEIPETLKILEARAPKELLDRLYKAKTGRDAHQVRTDFGICTFDDCWARYQVFEGAQWAYHEFSQHRFNRSWTCHLCHRVEVDDSAWLEHLSAAHLIDLKGAQMPLASRIACQVHSRPEQEKCHFCAEYPASNREDFEKHVGAHFHDACELIAAHSLERTQPRPSENTALPNSPTAEIDSSLDTHPQSIRPSPDLLGQGPFVSDLEVLDRDDVGDSTLLSSGLDTSPYLPIETTGLSLNTGYQNIVPASSVKSFPPAKAIRWQCGNCQERPVMNLDHEARCYMCHHTYDTYSTFYDRRGRSIEI